VCVLCFGFPFVAGAKELAKIEDELVALWDKVDTYKAKIEMKGESDQGGMEVSIEGKGILEGMTKDEKSLYRLEQDQSINMAGNQMTGKMLVVYDGELVYTQTTMMGQTFALKMKPEDQSQVVAIGGRKALEQMHKQFDVKVLPDAMVADEAVYVLELRPKEKQEEQPGAPGQQPQFDRAVMSIAKKTGFPVKVIMYGEGETPLMTMTYKELKLNPEIDPSRFQYTAPPGVMVLDAEALKQMGGVR
jgi:outer membrane lipoprotein-sorting protein